MWKLHNIIKDTLPKQEEEYLIMEVIKMMEGMSNSMFKDALAVMYMYNDNFHVDKKPAEFALMFVKGIKKNNVFSFESFLKSVIS